MKRLLLHKVAVGYYPVSWKWESEIGDISHYKRTRGCPIETCFCLCWCDGQIPETRCSRPLTSDDHSCWITCLHSARPTVSSPAYVTFTPPIKLECLSLYLPCFFAKASWCYFCLVSNCFAIMRPILFPLRTGLDNYFYSYAKLDIFRATAGRKHARRKCQWQMCAWFLK